jgi:SAM-dependent methyltransferase
MEPLGLTDANRAAIQQWTIRPCGMVGEAAESDLAYFEGVERERYDDYAPWMSGFVRFDAYDGQKILEVGVGQGTDLVQFAKGGAEVFGIDITPRHLDLAERNFSVRGLHANLHLASAAAIPFDDDTFDFVYSFGVLHHTDDTVRCISECRRVLRPGGELLLGLYHRDSLFHAYTVLVNGILRGQLRRFGYRGLMSRIEAGADGVTIAPLVKTYSRSQLRYILEDFKTVSMDVRHLGTSSRTVLPRPLVELAGRHIGWYLFARARK